MPRPLEPEARIGSYELVRRIGVGGMAEVWVARRVSERRANKYVAIKVVADQHVGNPRYHRMFKSEVELSALLNHVNIVQVFDEGEDDGRGYLVMEWVDGVNLLKIEAALTFIDDEAWRLKVITYIVGQLLYALNYAHSITLHDGNPLGIVHRDVSPQNVLVSAQGEVKLTDFGVAHYLLEESSGMHVKGKLRYMAPEQLGGKGRDPRIDLYAVGAILHELLDGRRFRYDVEDQQEMYIAVISGTIPALCRRVPPELDALRLGLLEPEMQRRIPTADAALEQLARFPGYGDARRELTQLCGGLTGVMRPRVGPGPSTAVPMATGTSVAASPPEPSRAAGQAEQAAVSMAASAGKPWRAAGQAEEAAASVAASAVQPSRVAGQAEQAAANVAASAVVGPTESPVQSTTLRLEKGAVGPQPVEQESTQPWMPPAVPRSVGQVASAPLYVANEATDPASPVSAPGPTATMARRRSSSSAPWVAISGAAMVALLGAGTWWLAVERPKTEGLEARQAVDDHALERSKETVDEPEATQRMAVGTPPPELAPESANTTGTPRPGTNEDPIPALAGDASSTGGSDAAGGSETGSSDDTGRSDVTGNSDDTGAPESSGAKPAPPKPEPTAPRAKQALTVVAVAALGAVQVEVRSKDGKVRKRYELRGSTDGNRLPVGSYTVKWRPVGASQWNKAQGVTLRRGCDLRVVIDAKGIKSVPMGSACR
ncbi:serine/threonine protein kinase [Paraliomyxa miuraensis]|uniref:serine/threonine protein kinase n=1 Tax=Paraliomyxa miuraensis TaxID=376150 RepID=UPI00225B5A0C|nr:serine/threonine-protein kinase [Paraliomyxa miuraensis]MCX4247130.1 protein kinase [Paraliomyxa miuraensis]